jgi:hypothetical protein
MLNTAIDGWLALVMGGGGSGRTVKLSFSTLLKKVAIFVFTDSRCTREGKNENNQKNGDDGSAEKVPIIQNS